MTRSLQCLGLAALIATLQIPALAKCPVSDGATVVVRAPIGNLLVETSVRDSVEVDDSKVLAVREVCLRDRVEYSADAPSQIRGTIDWKIMVPRTVNLDLVTLGGGIRMGDLDGGATLRTTGGSVTVGNIKGKTAIITQGGFIKAGNIGDSVELRSSSAGALEVGDVAGNADLHTVGGPIRTGIVSGKVTADTAGTIYIKGARGDATLTADPGDIYVGDGARINATSAGGSITVPRVRGAFKGSTESGDIRLESAGGSVEAITGYGLIYVRLNPETLDTDLHVDLQTGVGDITIFVPERLKAVVSATVDRPALNGRRIVSDFPMNGLAQNSIAPGRIPTRGVNAPPLVTNRFTTPDRQQAILNGGGNPIKLHTSLGKIEIFKIKL